MRSQLVGPLLALIERRGGDVGALLRRFDLPPTAPTDAEIRVPLDGLRTILDAAALAAGDPDLGIHLGQQLPRGAYGVLEYSCRSAPTVRDAIARITRYIGLLNELVTITAREERGAAVIEQAIAGEPQCLGRHGNEFFVVMLLARARQLSGAPCVPERAWFAHAAPVDPRALIAAVGTDRIRWNAGKNGLALPAAVLDLPLSTADPTLLALMDQQAEQALAGRAAPTRFLGDVKARIAAGLDAAPPEIAALAAQLRMSRRTLQRRLADEGVSFQTLVEDVRRERALELVADPARPLGEVAFQLGYAELSPFLRAFRRWTGTTPASWRTRSPEVARGVTGRRDRS
jgi:AraC-like DNA-binding protein